jgi:hypothetical protein
MKNLIFCFFILLFAISCKHGVAKLDINDVEAHRTYQDSLLKKSSISIEKLQGIRQLINEYLNLKVENKDNNSNYNYYLSRLYSYINLMPMNGIFYDSLNRKGINLDIYKNFYDSAYYYSELSLKDNPNNIRAMSIYARTLFWETERYKLFKAKKVELPFSSIQDNQKWNSRLNYLYSNFSKFYEIDTSQNKEISRGIFEYTFPFISQVATSLITKGINWSDDNELYTFNYVGKCIELLDKLTPKEIDIDYYKKKSRELLPFTRIAIEKIKLGPIRNFLDKELYQRGWSSTEHSLDGDIQTSRGSLIEYTNASPNESEIVFRLNSDYSYNITFKPIRYISTVTVSGKWKLSDDSSIEFDKDIFVSVPVTSADFPISEEPFHEYNLILKKVKISNGYLVLDHRSTNRSTFFVQLAIVQQGNNLSAETYAFNSLSELSLEKDLLTQYLGYFK